MATLTHLVDSCERWPLRARRAVWADPNTYAKVAARNAPFVELYSSETQRLIGEPTPQVVFAWNAGAEADWLPYDGPLDAAER